MRALLVGLFIAVAEYMAAHAATCGPGYYLDASGGCARCNNAETEAKYCPGDDLRHDCPRVPDDVRRVAMRDTGGVPDDDVPGYDWTMQNNASGVHAWYVSRRAYLADSIELCGVDVLFRDNRGRYIWMGQWVGDADTGEYKTVELLYYQAFDGYYLADLDSESWHKWYRSVKECHNAPRNAHYVGAGTPEDMRNTSCDDCLYQCDGGASCQTACDAGMSCLVADVGVVGYLWNEPVTMHSVAIAGPRGVCYANLSAGSMTGTVNISLGDGIYHVAP